MEELVDHIVDLIQPERPCQFQDRGFLPLVTCHARMCCVVYLANVAGLILSWLTASFARAQARRVAANRQDAEARTTLDLQLDCTYHATAMRCPGRAPNSLLP